LREPPFHAVYSVGNGGVAQSRKGAKHGRFFCPKKEAVFAFLCVFAPLREAPFQATAWSRKAEKAQSTAVSSLPRRSPFLSFFASLRLCVRCLFTLFLNVSHGDFQ
jgi:hypothetical protein